jgi:thiol-disulfide isomerase/thioredoxin
MSPLTPRPILLALTLLLVVVAVAYFETRLDATGADASDSRAEAQAEGNPPVEKTNASATAGYRDGPATGSRETVGATGKSEPQDATNRIASKEAEYTRAEELVTPSGFINASDFSIKDAAQEKVVLLEFWTYTCYNCQNVQPYLNAWHDEYADEGLQVVGVHTPEFGFERDYDNVEVAVREAGIEYPVVLDNSYATWNAYDSRYWPAVYLIDADGFIRYKHFGEGAYEETEATIQQLLAEKDRIAG